MLVGAWCTWEARGRGGSGEVESGLEAVWLRGLADGSQPVIVMVNGCVNKRKIAALADVVTLVKCGDLQLMSGEYIRHALSGRPLPKLEDAFQRVK